MKVKSCDHEAHGHDSEERLQWAVSKIKESGLRVTNQRIDLLKALLKAKKPLSAEEIFSHLRKGSSDLATVFRSVGNLEEVGILQRHELGDNIRRYEVAQESNHHHHFVRCRSCGNVEAFDGCNFEKLLEKILGKRGYHQIQHSLEVKALCPQCKAA